MKLLNSIDLLKKKDFNNKSSKKTEIAQNKFFYA
jgi:hypothetical protein